MTDNIDPIRTFFSWLFMTTAIAIMLLYGLCSCSSYVPVSKEVHDSIFVTKHDTLKLFQKEVKRDTIIERHDTTIIVREDGSILERTITNNYYRVSESNDSSSYYKSIIDSLMKSKSDASVVEKKKSLLEETIDECMAGAVIFFFVVCFFIVCIKVLKS